MTSDDHNAPQPTDDQQPAMEQRGRAATSNGSRSGCGVMLAIAGLLTTVHVIRSRNLADRAIGIDMLVAIVLNMVDITGNRTENTKYMHYALLFLLCSLFDVVSQIAL